MFFDTQRLPGTCGYWEFQSTRMLARLPSALRGAKLLTRRVSCAKNHSLLPLQARPHEMHRPMGAGHLKMIPQRHRLRESWSRALGW